MDSCLRGVAVFWEPKTIKHLFFLVEKAWRRWRHFSFLKMAGRHQKGAGCSTLQKRPTNRSLIYLAQLFFSTLSNFRENNTNWKFPYAFNTTAQPTAVLVTRAVCKLPKCQFARVSNTFTLNSFPNLLNRYVHISRL